MVKNINDFRKWLQATETSGYVQRSDAIAFLNDCPPDDWAIGARLICNYPGLPVIYISYLLEKLDILEMENGWMKIFDEESIATFLQMKGELVE